MLRDEARSAQHADVVRALAWAGGPAVGHELVALLREDLAFWKATAPQLRPGWWNGTGLGGPDVEQLRNRYGRTLQILYALRELRVAAGRDAVTELRDYWRSLPQLEDQSGLNQMSQECDNVLRALAGPGEQR